MADHIRQQHLRSSPGRAGIRTPKDLNGETGSAGEKALKSFARTDRRDCPPAADAFIRSTILPPPRRSPGRSVTFVVRINQK
jgi:hypothetical protein